MKPRGSAYDRLVALLRAHPDDCAANLEAHFRRYLAPFVLVTIR
jgi:hypothetical protein